jgi:hypothetical protein
MSKTTIVTLLAGVAALTFVGIMPAEAGQRTGSWKYSPEEIYSQQRQSRWQRQHWGGAPQRGHYGQGYGQGRGQGYGQGYYRPQNRQYYPPPYQSPVAGPVGGPGMYGQP